MADLCTVVARALQVDPTTVDIATGPVTLAAWDSHAHTRIVVAVEEHFHVVLSEEEIMTIFSISDIASILRSRGIDAA